MGEYWGYHQSLDCANCSDGIKSREVIEAFVKDLVKRIDMEAYGPPLIEHFATHDHTKAGYSLCQMISTSNISAHYVDATGESYIDIFSCKPFSREEVIQCVKDYFNPEHIIEHFILRKAFKP